MSEVNDTVNIIGIDSVVVVLQWSSQDGVSYNINIIPQVNATFIGRAKIQMLVYYNIIYNVSITATLCGLNTVTSIVTLNYGMFIAVRCFVS